MDGRRLLRDRGPLIGSLRERTSQWRRTLNGSRSSEMVREKKSARQPIRVPGAIRHYYFAKYLIRKMPSRKFCGNDCAMLCDAVRCCAMLCDVVRSCASGPRVCLEFRPCFQTPRLKQEAPEGKLRTRPFRVPRLHPYFCAAAPSTCCSHIAAHYDFCCWIISSALLLSLSLSGYDPQRTTTHRLT